MTVQLTLDLPPRVDLSWRDFFESPENELARAEMNRWPDWPQGKLMLLGPEAAGKSHLAQIWADRMDGRTIPAQALCDAGKAAALSPATETRHLVVEDVSDLAGNAEAELSLLHLHNLTLAEGKRLLMTGRGDPEKWGIALPDLASRILGTPSVTLTPPESEMLRQALLVKHFADRGVAVQPSLILWLSRRVDRNYAALRRIVADLDREALASGRPLGRKLAAEVLGLPRDPAPSTNA